jgi:hypothetical protein
MKLRELITELERGGDYEQARQVRETYRGSKKRVAHLGIRELITELETGGDYEQAKKVREARRWTNNGGKFANI